MSMLLAPVDVIARALPAALSTGAASGGAAVAATAGSPTLTVSILGGVTAILGTAVALVVQLRKAGDDNVPAMRKRMKTAEADVAKGDRRLDEALARAEARRVEQVGALRAELDEVREQMMAAERRMYAAHRALGAAGLAVPELAGEPS